MKKINIFIIILASLFLVSCSKTPFKEEKPLDNYALVYIYVMPDDGINDTNRISNYEVKINGEYSKASIDRLEFLKFDLKPETVSLSVVRSGLEEKTLNLNLQKGKTYFLRVQSYSDDFGKYKFERVDQEIALKELYLTKSALVEEDKENIADVIIDNDKGSTIEDESKKSKLDKIKDAHKLKEDGIITQEEFDKLKAEIINAD